MDQGIAFITEANERIGYGHLYRCIALAQSFDEAGKTVVFFVDTETEIDVIKKILPNAIIKKDTFHSYFNEKIKRLNSVILDVYPDNISNYKYLEELKQGITVTIVDYPFADKTILTDLVFKIGFQDYQNKKEVISHGEGKESTHFSGNDFFIFRKEFSHDFNFHCRPAANKILVTMGGSDPSKLTELVAESIELVNQQLEVTYVLGNGFTEERISMLKDLHYNTTHNIVYQKNINNMAKVMANNDIAIINGGNTRFELAKIGVPFFSVSIHANQEKISQHIAKNGIGKSIGIGSMLKPQDIANVISGFLINFDERCKMSRRMKIIFNNQIEKPIINHILNT